MPSYTFEASSLCAFQRIISGRHLWSFFGTNTARHLWSFHELKLHANFDRFLELILRAICDCLPELSLVMLQRRPGSCSVSILAA